jgi:methylglutaconyl-CoA hydratase
MSTGVRVSVHDGVATITLDRPDRRNALSRDLVRGLQAGLDATASDDAVRVVVLTGAGPTFCAGADLDDVPGGTTAEDGDDAAADESLPHLLDGVLASMLDHPRPIVGRVTGAAYGGGLGLVAACDLVVAGESTRLCFSEVRLGVVPAAIAPYVLRKVPAVWAAQLMLLAEPFSPTVAQDAGLLTRVVADDAVDAGVEAWCEHLALAGPQALAVTKRVITRVPGLPTEQARAWASAVSAAAFASEEAAEGMAAFRERRPPSWATVGRTGH